MSDNRRLWVITSNDRKLIQRVLSSADLGAAELSFPQPGVLGAAIFANGDEVLSIRRPVVEGSRLDAHIDQRLRSYRLVATYHPTNGETFRAERTQPFRHKSWIFALCGDAPPAEQPTSCEEEQAFVSRYVRGPTTRELLMGRVMWRLYKRDARGLITDPEVLRDVLTQAIEPIRSDAFASYTAVLSTDDVTVLTSQGRQVHYRPVTRLKRIEGEPVYNFTDPSASPGSHLRASVVVDGPVGSGGEWTRLEDGQTLVLGELPPPALV